MQKLHSLIRRHWPVITFFIIFLFIFRKIFFHGLWPFPGDLLVSWFFPYNSGGWLGYSPWTTHKEFILADVVRQIYPWRTLAIDLIKQGIIPLWNLYSFSGNPLLANLQSAVFYPLNFLFFIFNGQLAWLIYIIIQPILACYFMYLFIRSLKLSRLAGLISGITFAFMGYLSVWFEMGIVGHSALWLPFVLWGITKYIANKRQKYLVLSAFGLACSILAGHAQTSAYVLLLSTIYFFYTAWSILPTRQFLTGLTTIFLGIGLAAIQIIPSLELMFLSARDALSSAKTFYQFVIPWSHSAMLFAPDFFGNPATGNFWGKDYGEFMSYIGVVALFFAFIGFYVYRKKPLIRLLQIVTVISLLTAFYLPVAKLLFLLRIPILSTGLPSRALFLAGFSLVVGTAYGVKAVQKLPTKKLLLPITLFLLVYLGLWLVVFFAPVDPVHLVVTKRNLILPTGVAFLLSFLVIFKHYFKQFALIWFIVFILMALEYSYFLNKYLPWSPSQFIYPTHQLINKLTDLSKTERIYGYDTASIGTNLPVQWRLLSPEGYDPLYIRRYSEFMRAGTTGKLEENLYRTDADLPRSLPIDDTYRKQILLNLLGVGYTLDKDDNTSNKWTPKSGRFPDQRFELIYQKFKWQIYENEEVLPRAAVFYDFVIIKSKAKSIKTLFNSEFPYRRKLILENSVNLKPKPGAITPAEIVSYTANEVKIATETKQAGLLFLSDNYYPGWRAYLDGQSVQILRADYTFRAIELPKGKHKVRFSYQPLSFYSGALVSFISLLILLASFRRKNLEK